MQARTKRWVRRVLLGTTVAVVFGGGLTVYLLRRPPAVWNQAQQILAETTPEQRAEQADAVLDRLTALVAPAPEASAPTPDPSRRPSLDRQSADETEQAQVKPSSVAIDQTHEMRLTNEELVAMVSQVFRDWTAQRGYVVPDAITEPVVLADDGRLVIAFQVRTSSWSQVFSGHVDLTFRPDGMAVGRVQKLTAGSLPMSINEVGDMLRKRLPAGEKETGSRVGDWLSQLEGFEFRPVLEMEHRRRARVVGMQVGRDAVTLKMRVQDHATYKRHNVLLETGRVAVTDSLDGVLPSRDAIADVPTTTE